MVRYKFSLCIGQANTDSGITVKCHDDGISFLIKLMVCRQVSKWRTTEEAFTIPEGSKVVLKIAKPDNTKCLISGTVKADGVLFKLRPEAFTVAGISEAEVSVYGPDGRRATTATFNIDVPQECVCNCEVESGPYIDILGEQIDAAREAEAGAKEAAKVAMEALTKAPKVGDNGNWFVWDIEKGKHVDTGIAASGTDGADGKDGIDGKNGIDGKDGKDGINGKDGIDGKDGVSVTKAEINNKGELVITLSNNTVSNLGIVVGAKGDKGDKGETGATGATGEQGIQGEKGDKGDKGDTGAAGQDGKDGVDGKNGVDGYTPQKGVDYWTEADKNEILGDIDQAIAPIIGTGEIT